jgi:hypothetical protein
MMTEQRKNRRYDLRLPCEILRPAKPPLNGETRNLSSAGVLLKSAERISVGETIEYFVTLLMPPESGAEVRLKCIGKVLRAHNHSSFAASMERYEFVRHPLT